MYSAWTYFHGVQHEAQAGAGGGHEAAFVVTGPAGWRVAHRRPDAVFGYSGCHVGAIRCKADLVLISRARLLAVYLVGGYWVSRLHTQDMQMVEVKLTR